MIDPIQPTHRRKFDKNKLPVEVYTTPDRELFLKIDHQTFELKCRDPKEDDEIKHEEWLAQQLCFAINRLVKNSAKEVFDATPLTLKLANKQTQNKTEEE